MNLIEDSDRIAAASKLPVRPTPVAAAMDEDRREKVMELVGEASTCWVDGHVPTGVFDTARAIVVGEKILALIDAEVAARKHMVDLLRHAPEPFINPRHEINSCPLCRETVAVLDGQRVLAWDYGRHHHRKVVLDE